MMNQGARNKLRNMGGIMASSPKLMQAAFQAGGPAMPVPPSMQFNDAARGRIGPPVAGLGRIAPMMPTPAMPDGALPGFDPMQTEAERLMAQSALPRQGIMPLPGEGPLGDVIKKQQDIAAADEVARGERVQRRQESRTKELRDRLAAANTPEEKAAISAQLNELDTARQEGVTRGQPLTTGGDGEALLPPDRPINPDEKARATEQALRNLIPRQAQEDPETAQKVADDAMSELLRTMPGPDGGDGGGDDGDGGPPPAPSKKDLRSRYKEKIALFKEIYGEDDEDRARDKAMSLAMLGLAIASGQSPDFLTNVTQGTMAGLQGMSEQERARRERDRGLQTLALETAIGEQSAEAEAAARAAEQEAEFQNRLDVANIRSSGGGGAGLNKINAASRLLREEIAALRTGIPAGTVIVPKGVDQEAFIQDLARKNVDQLLRLQVAQDFLRPEEYTKITDALEGSSSVGASIPAPANAKPGQRIRDNQTGTTYVVQDDNTMMPEG